MKKETWFNEFEEFLSFTNEKEILLNAIKSKISHLPSKKRFLDYGAGTCYFTNRLAKNFQEVVAVDKKKRSKKYLTAKNAKFLFPNELEKDNEKFDFILLSYVLGTTFSANHEIIEKVIKKLSKNGVICIISLSEYNNLAPKFKQVCGATNYFNKLVLQSNGLFTELNHVRAKYFIPRRKENLFNNLFGISSIQDIINNFYRSKKEICFSLIHNLMFASHKYNRTIFLFSGLVASGKTTLAKKFSNTYNLKYVSIDDYLRSVAKANQQDMDKFLFKLSKNNQIAVAELIANLLDSIPEDLGSLVIDGVFSAEEIDFIRHNSAGRIVSIYVDAKKCTREFYAMKRQSISLTQSKKYLRKLDYITETYSGGVFDKMIYNYKIDNNDRKDRKSIKLIFSEIHDFTFNKNNDETNRSWL
ncbi:MAG: methyltransferase domain-containing protein [Candidatus Izemoplasmatales bacterium]|jgi:cytidylate kinase/SAM-dependent methyltransferase